MVSLSIGAALPIWLVCFHASPAVLAPAPELLLVGVMLLTWFCGWRGLVIILPVCWALLAGGWLVESRLLPSLDGGDFVLRGVVCNVPRRESGIQRFVLRLADDAVGQGIPRRIYLSWYDAEHEVRAGQAWQLSVRLRRPRGVRNPAGFDAERWAFLNDYGATGFIRKSASNALVSGRSETCRWPAIRQQLAAELLARVPEATAAAYLPALAVGIRTGLGTRDWLMLQRTGTAHLMAISGLHIGLAAGCAFWFMRGAGRMLLLAGVNLPILRLAQAAALLTALAYSLLAGFALPAQRAFVMTAAVILLSTVYRAVSPLAALAIALYASLWLTPFAVLTGGFWMSFGAVCVLLLSGFALQHRLLHGDMQTARQALRMRCVQLGRAQLFLAAGMLPLTAAWFAQVSFVAPLINLVVVPLFAVTVIPLLLTGVLALIVAPTLSSVPLGAADVLLGYMVAMLKWLSDTYPVATGTPYLSAESTVALCLLSLLVLWPRPLPGRTALIMCAGLLLCAGWWSQRLDRPELRLVVLDTGQGLSVLIQSQDHAALYDTGPRFRSGDAGRSIVLPVLRHYGITRLDHLVVSHADADHAGGLGSILDAVPVNALLVSDGAGLAEPFSLCRAGQRWRYGQVVFSMLHPDPQRNNGRQSENDASCVLAVSIGQVRILLPGDIERRAEQQLVNSHILGKMTLVIAPHHGSRTSSTQAFVSTLTPEFVVISAGHRNRWGFPAAEVLARWRKAGACLLSTARHGALVFEVRRGSGLQLVSRWRIDAARIWSASPQPAAIQPACAGRLL